MVLVLFSLGVLQKGIVNDFSGKQTANVIKGIKNRSLSWSGRNLFPTYIYQRMPMLAFSTITISGITLLDYSLPLYIFMSIGITILIAYFHKYIAIKFNG